MKIAFFPGSFSEFHDGHKDVLSKALKVFDKIVILQMSNGEKASGEPDLRFVSSTNVENVECLYRPNMSITKAIGNYILGQTESHQYAIIRGMRNTNDFIHEQMLQYAYEDIGIKIPIFFIMSDRSLIHMSSILVKEMNKYKEKL